MFDDNVTAYSKYSIYPIISYNAPPNPIYLESRGGSSGTYMFDEMIPIYATSGTYAYKLVGPIKIVVENKYLYSGGTGTTNYYLNSNLQFSTTKYNWEIIFEYNYY